MADSDFNAKPLIIILVLFLTLTSLSVTLRFYVRLWITRAFELDDYFMLASLINFIIDCAMLFTGIHYGLGRHNEELSEANQIQALKYQTLATLGYISNMMFIKFSIALFLLRLAVQRRYIWILRISMSIVAVWSIAIFFYYLFQCKPVAAQWDFTITDGKCASSNSFTSAAYSISVMTISTDWLYALLPIPMIWSVQMTYQAKITVIIILSLGIFASIATIIRLRYLDGLDNVSDEIFNGTVAMIWTLVEPGVAITAASLITIRPLLRALHISGFDSGELSYSIRNRGNGGHSGFGRGHPNPRSDPNALSLRNDVLENNWSSTVDCQMQRVGIRGSKGGADVKEEDIGMGSPVSRGDGGSEEFILDGSYGIGVRRTVNVSVEHDKSRERKG